jgi:outer membrane protein OmpA-like peptidoglycan-associated protein
VLKQTSLSVVVASAIFMSGCGADINKMGGGAALEMKKAVQDQAISTGVEIVLEEIGKSLDGQITDLLSDEAVRADVVKAILDNLRQPVTDKISHIVKGSKDVATIDWVKTGQDIYEALKPTIQQLLEEHLPQEEAEPVEEAPEPVVIPTEDLEAINSVEIKPNLLPSINQNAKDSLTKIANFLKENSDKKIVIGSHTDATGSNAYNLELSQKRAEFLAEYLVSLGVAHDQIEAKGYGEEELLDTANPNSLKNRRVEVEITEK